MELFNNIKEIKIPFPNAAITLGNFDGVHRGHRALLQKTIEKAKQINGTSVAVTFEPHPLKALGIKDIPIITAHDQKIELIAQSGVDVLVCIPFDKAFASISPLEFIDQILVKTMGMKAVIIGPDYTFGSRRQGNVELLETKGREFGYETIVLSWIRGNMEDSQRISSTQIRKLISEGKVKDVHQFLGRPHQIRGTVVHGRNRGGELLKTPTANIDPVHGLCPKPGVYAVTVKMDGKTFPGAANIGFSPTFADGQFTVEIHILDFDEDVYGKTIHVNMIERIRGEETFSNIEDLMEKISQDITITRRILQENGHT